jgi:Fe2+ or Zn2+ uptake regulation protein
MRPMSAAEKRDNHFKMRMTDQERQMLEALAEREGLSASGVVRQLVRREHREVFGEPKPKRPSKR